MPRFDGTGPQDQGPMTGRGEGYCAVEIPDGVQDGRAYAGLQGATARSGDPTVRPTLGSRFARWANPATWFGGTRGRGRGAGTGRGRRAGRW